MFSCYIMFVHVVRNRLVCFFVEIGSFVRELSRDLCPNFNR